MHKSGIAIILFASSLSATNLSAAEFRSFASKDSRVLISVIGELVDGDTERFKTAVKSANDAGKFVANIRLNSIGGSLLEGVKLAQAVQFAKIATNVGKNGICASACFLVFAAGSTKFANYSAKIGVHGASTRSGEEAGDATVTMARVAKEIGVPPAIIGRMVVTPPTDMVWLSPQELQSMGVSLVGKPVQVSIDEQPKIGAPRQISSENPNDVSSETKASAPPSWNAFVEKAIRVSASQNNGKPIHSRSCQPALKICFDGIFYKDRKGTHTLAKVVKDMNDKIIRREVCEFNSSMDIRKCFDWDDGTVRRDMKDSNGNWSKVADE